MTRKVVLIVQARMGSSRLPGKMMLEIAGRPAIGHVLARVGLAQRIDDVWLACSDVTSDDPLAAYGQSLGVSIFRGDENDVLSRFVAVAEKTEADVLVRITGDCPMADPVIIDKVVDTFLAENVDFVSNTLTRSYPDGLDVEVFSRAALDRTAGEVTDPFLRAHVTPYIHGRLKDRLPWGAFTQAQFVNDADFSHLRWTLDEQDDLAFFQSLLERLPEGYGWMDAVAEITREPRLLYINAGHEINEGTNRDLDGGEGGRIFSQSNSYFERAEKTVPLATQTFSKSHQQWVKGATPLFMDRGRGCRVWDVDNNAYIDHVLGLLPVVLGYCDPDVNEAISRQMEKGICFPLASPLEAELAECLVRLIPCAEKVRFGKNGSDVTAAAVRLARAHTGRDRILVCGYHGWHDWYIGSTTRDLGVPEAVKDLTTAVAFNDLDALEGILKRNGDQIAAIVMEPTSKDPAKLGYLEGVRALTERHGVLLVFDEIITGFRVSMGGAQAISGVTPDLACFGKAMGNGMPISAIVGRGDIMKGMEDIFFSATFGGEALSLAAAIATIDKLERENGPARLARRGSILKERINGVLAEAGLADVVCFGGEDWWPRLALTSPPVDPNMFNSLLRQEFVANGLLIGASLNLSLAHDDDTITEQTVAGISLAAQAVRAAIESSDPGAHLRGEMIQPTFSVRS